LFRGIEPVAGLIVINSSDGLLSISFIFGEFFLEFGKKDLHARAVTRAATMEPIPTIEIIFRRWSLALAFLLFFGFDLCSFMSIC
jgi:hypothetical protein